MSCGCPAVILCGHTAVMLFGYPAAVSCGYPAVMSCGYPAVMSCGYPAVMLCGNPAVMSCSDWRFLSNRINHFYQDGLAFLSWIRNAQQRYDTNKRKETSVVGCMAANRCVITLSHASCSATQHADAGVGTVNLCIKKLTF